MSLNRDQFAVVLAGLKARLRAGEWVNGEPLTVGDLATEYGVSATPIREALSRFAGEGLVEDRRGRGYFAHRVDGLDLLDLYRTQETLALIGLSAARCAAGAPPSSLSPAAFMADPVSAWEAVTESLVLCTDSPTLRATHLRLADRLAPARAAEAEIVSDPDEDFAILLAGAKPDGIATVREAVRRLMGRRREAADRIAARLRTRSMKYKSSI